MIRILYTLTTITLLSASAGVNASSVVDRYTSIRSIETKAQSQPLSVEISIKFAKNIINVKQAIDHLLLKSGYELDNNYESEKISHFRLPEVHRSIGPISLKRAIKVLLGPAWNLQVDELSRSVQIVQTGSHTLQILNPDAKAMLKGVITPDVLDEVVAVSINDELIVDAFDKILPNGWKVKLENEYFKQKLVSVVSEDLSREKVIKKVLSSINAQGYFYKKLKLLVVRDKTKVIK